MNQRKAKAIRKSMRKAGIDPTVFKGMYRDIKKKFKGNQNYNLEQKIQ